jgi:hypothetical protein
MDTLQNPAADKLYKKLAALRVTLPDDERDVFDQIIPAEEEVTAHRMRQPKRVAKKTAKKAPEVTAHTMKKTPKRAPKRTAKKAAKK